jgi:hypothetical protein
MGKKIGENDLGHIMRDGTTTYFLSAFGLCLYSSYERAMELREAGEITPDWYMASVLHGKIIPASIC